MSRSSFFRELDMLDRAGKIMARMSPSHARRRSRVALALTLGSALQLFTMHGSALAQRAISVDGGAAPAQSGVAQNFQFVTDGPSGAGWSRPDEIPRVFFNEDLPAFFTRTITLDGNLPMGGRLSWIFTGPHAGFTVQVTGSKIRVIQRYYDSTGLGFTSGNYPEKIVQDDEQQFEGAARSVRVDLDSHMSLRVSVNGKELLRQSCLFDVSRHQLVMSAPRVVHAVVQGSLLKTTVEESRVTVNPSAKHQEMLGFGGSPSIPAYMRLSESGKNQYWDILKHYNLLIDREYPMGSELKPDMSNLDDVAEATPHYYGDNFPNSEVSSFDYSKRALAAGGLVVYEMWALPPWAVEPYKSSQTPVIDAWNKVVKSSAKPEEYARAMVEYCRRAKERTGSAPAIVGVQNEVEQPPEIFDAMVLTLRKELDRAGFTSTRIHMADASFLWMGIERAERLQHNPAVWKVIDFTAAHEYDFQEFFANPDMYDNRLKHMHKASGDKQFLATEICLNDPHLQEPSYRVAFNAGQLYHKNLTLLDAVSIMYCWLLLETEQPTFEGSRSLLKEDRSRGYAPVASSFELRVLGAFSRHVLRGMRRVDTSSSNPDLLVSAFEGGDRSAVILLNRSSAPQHVTTSWAGKRWTEIERTSPYLENTTSKDIPSSLVVQPGEIAVLSSFSAE